MSTPHTNGNPQIALLLELLRSSMAAPASGPGHPGQGANAGPSLIMPPLPVATKRLSATDLLTGWFQPESAATNPWDDYFGDAPQAAPGGAGSASPELALLLQLLTGAANTAAPPTPQPASPQPAAQPGDSPYLWIDLWDFMDQSPADVVDDEAEAAVTCLYDFIHALGRRDVNAAMECVAPHYHVFENEQETDRLGLRHQMESMLDSLRDWLLDVSLLEVPRPIAHPNGILIDANIQIHATHPGDNLRRLITYHRMAVLEQQSYYHWQITALSPLK